MTWKPDPIQLPQIDAPPSPATRPIEATGLQSPEPALRILYQGRLQIDAHAIARSLRAPWRRLKPINLLAAMAAPGLRGALSNRVLQRLAGTPYPALKAWQELTDEPDE